MRSNGEFFVEENHITTFGWVKMTARSHVDSDLLKLIQASSFCKAKG